MDEPLTAFIEELRSFLSRMTNNVGIREHPGEHPLDKIIVISTPGIDMPVHARHKVSELARSFAPPSFRHTFVFKDKSDPCLNNIPRSKFIGKRVGPSADEFEHFMRCWVYGDLIGCRDFG